MKYNYCSVKIEDFKREFFYIYDGDDIKYGDRVLVPFGHENRVVCGVVSSTKFYSLDFLPFPLERTKKIISVIRPGRELSEFEEDVIFGKDFEKLKKYIEDKNYDLIFQWAYEHEPYTDSRAVKQKVEECYSMCVEQNMPEAFSNLANIYYDGRSLKKNFKRAFELYTTAASFSIQDGFSGLGCCYYYGKGVRKNFKKAYENFCLGALLYDDCKCLYMIGDMFRDGDFVEKNNFNAFSLYERAFARTDKVSVERYEMWMRLGRCYMDAIGTKEDLKMAHNCFTKALEGLYIFRNNYGLDLKSVEECRAYLGIVQKKMSMEILKEDCI